MFAFSKDGREQLQVNELLLCLLHLCLDVYTSLMSVHLCLDVHASSIHSRDPAQPGVKGADPSSQDERSNIRNCFLPCTTVRGTLIQEFY